MLFEKFTHKPTNVVLWWGIDEGKVTLLLSNLPFSVGEDWEDDKQIVLLIDHGVDYRYEFRMEHYVSRFPDQLWDAIDGIACLVCAKLGGSWYSIGAPGTLPASKNLCRDCFAIHYKSRFHLGDPEQW